MCPFLRNEKLVSGFFTDSICEYFHIHFTLIYSGFIEANNIEDYLPNREKYLNRGRGSDYKNAIAKIDEFLTDPLVIISFVLLIRYEKYFHMNSYSYKFPYFYSYLILFLPFCVISEIPFTLESKTNEWQNLNQT